jgi:hypothetical protein
LLLVAISKDRSSEEFQECISKYLNGNLSKLVRANIKMIQVYVFIREKSYLNASTELIGMKLLFEQI